MIKMFVTTTCKECKKAVELYEQIKALGFDIQLHDTGTTEGLAEASFYGVLKVPSLLFKNKDGDIVGWHGNIPDDLIELDMTLIKLDMTLIKFKTTEEGM